MIYCLMLIFSWILENSGLAHAYDYNQCKGDQQTIVIPHGYDQNVPDASETGNITIVWITYRIQRLKEVKEER